MALGTYAQLKTAITYWLDISSTDLTNQIDDLVTLGEKRIFRESKTKDQETALSVAIASGVAAVPNDYVALKFVYINSDPTAFLERRSAEWIYAAFPQRGASGKPQFIAREGSNFIFGPYPDSNYTIKGVYYKTAGTLSSSVYDLFTNNPDLYLFACLAESEPIIGRDKRIVIWEAKYQKILADVNAISAREDASGGTLRMRLM